MRAAVAGFPPLSSRIVLCLTVLAFALCIWLCAQHAFSDEFSIYLTNQPRGSEILLGGVDASRALEPLRYYPMMRNPMFDYAFRFKDMQVCAPVCGVRVCVCVLPDDCADARLLAILCRLTASACTCVRRTGAWQSSTRARRSSSVRRVRGRHFLRLAAARGRGVLRACSHRREPECCVPVPVRAEQRSSTSLLSSCQ